MQNKTFIGQSAKLFEQAQIELDNNWPIGELAPLYGELIYNAQVLAFNTILNFYNIGGLSDEQIYELANENIYINMNDFRPYEQA